MSPRGILLRSIPVFGKGCFAKQSNLGRMTNRLFFEHGYKRTTSDRQMNVFKQPNNSLLVDDSFNRLNHTNIIADLLWIASA